MATTKKGAPKPELERLERLRTPKGTAAFAYLKRPDDAFGTEKFRITVIPDSKDPDFKKFVTTLRALAKANGLAVSDIPIKKANERLAETLDIKVGTPYFEAEQKVFRTDRDGNPKPLVPVPLFDARGKRNDTADVWGGDIVRAEVMVGLWSMPGGKRGLKLYLEAVQLLKSTGGSGGRGASFEAEEDYIEDDSPSADDSLGDTLEAEDAEEVDDSSELSEDDIPF